MRKIRLITFAAAFSVLAIGILVALYPYYLSLEPHRRAFSVGPLSQGEILDFAALLPDESVIMEFVYLACDGPCTAKRFVFSRDTETMAMFDCRIRWHRFSEADLVSDRLAGVFPVLPSDFEGLSAAMRLFRTRSPNIGTASITYRVEYQRGGKRIGEERFWLSHHMLLSREDRTREGYREIARNLQIPFELFDGVVTPDMIAERRGEPGATANPDPGEMRSEKSPVSESPQPGG